MRRRTGRMAAMAAVAAVLATAAQAGPVRPGEQQGLGLTGPEIPDILKKAKADTYAPPAEPACQSLPAELDALNEVLGPDADQAQPKRNVAGKWVGGAIRGLIPHRDVIRFLTGAGKKDDALKQAAMAGWARRGYLKGLAKTLDCTSTHVASADQAAAPASANAPTAADADAIAVSDTATSAVPTPEVKAEPLAAVPPT